MMSATAAALGVLVVSAVLLVVMMSNGQIMTKTSTPSSQQSGSRPQSINASAVQFILFTRYGKPAKLQVNDEIGFNNSGFDFTNPTKIIIHGFLSSIRQDVFVLTKNAYLTNGDYNVIGMDWSALCEFEYFSAMRGAQMAASALTGFLNFLFKMGVDYDQVHLIGHSLGAHVAGMGADILSGGKVARITVGFDYDQVHLNGHSLGAHVAGMGAHILGGGGEEESCKDDSEYSLFKGLDPAGPGYGDVSHNLRLDPGDAKLVDIIHTYMRILSLAEPVGHVDFYPNGGRYQPGCPDIFDIWRIPESISCNHGRAYVYFVESIQNKHAFKSQRCASIEEAVYGRCFEESNVYMGQADTYESGLYYVRTNAQPPFSISH